MDTAIVQWVNGFASRSAIGDAVGIFAATGLIFFLAAAAVWMVYRTSSERRMPLVIELIVTLCIAYGVSQIIGAVAFRPRPFVAHDRVQLLITKDAGSKSFPSDHATLAFALAIPLAAAFRREHHHAGWAAALIVAAALIGIGRVFVGVHYLTDILAGALLAFLAWRITVRAIIAYFPNRAMP